ncbi:intradiol ring-cleavage dioxygenase [Pseudorhodoferax sp.]|uniref:intradiol ring-cleavage dioxygenase n=1 Tax=Pseudorhodoferax sp. TaxID=1993553 RepID=UPI0039E5985D
MTTDHPHSPRPPADRPAHAHAGHGHGLAEDLAQIAQLRLPRRRAMSWLATAAGSGLALAGGPALAAPPRRGAAAGHASPPGAAGAPASSGGSSSTASTSGTSNSSCTAYATETNGPYPADGTNSASGATSDILTASGVVRSDIRSSFLGTGSIAQGVPLALTLTLVDSNGGCAPLPGYAVYVWHCDRAGLYSLYTAPAESYLRGVQVTDANGQVSFTTIFPACYAGRWPHIHMEVFASLASATTGRNALLVSQLALPSAACSAVYSGASGYSASVSNFSQITLASDNVFGDNGSAQLAAMTPAMSGSVSAGYAGTATVGLAA